MDNNKMTNIVSMGLSLTVLILVLGVIVFDIGDDSVVDPRVADNVAKIAELEELLETTVKSHGGMYIMMADISRDVEIVANVTASKIGLEDLELIEARLLVVENAINVLSDNQIEIATHASTQTAEDKDFSLVLMTRHSEVWEIFSINDVIYITGDASVTTAASLDMKIKDRNGTMTLSKTFGIPAEGRFTTIFMVPALSTGDYIINLTDGTIVDSIKFQID